MPTDKLAEAPHFPEQEIHEAIQRRDVIGLIGCVQGYIMRIVAISPLIYDVQQGVIDRVLATLKSESIQVNSTQESNIRELLQTVYRGMRGANTRSDSIKRLIEKGVPLLEGILAGEKLATPTTPPNSVSPKVEEVLQKEEITSPPVTPASTAESEKITEIVPRKSKYFADNPPQIPDGFTPDWNTKKWRTFCRFYGYSPETGVFDAHKSLPKTQIAEELGVTLLDIAVYFTNIHKDLASWVPKPKKNKKTPKKLTKPPRVPREKPVKVLKEKLLKPKREKPQKEVRIISKLTPTTPKKPIRISPIEGYEDEDEDLVDDGELTDERGGARAKHDDRYEDNSGELRKGIDLSDGMSSFVRQVLQHPILSSERVNELGSTIQSAAVERDQILLTEELLETLKNMLQYTPPRIGKNISISSVRRSVYALQVGEVLTGELLTSIRKIASSFLVGNARQKELADTILAQINGEITRKAQMAINELVVHNQKLVYSIAKRFTNRGVDLLDLQQEGSIGVQKAALRFDPLRGIQFSTYATWWIRQAITRAIADQSRTIRVPIYIQGINSTLRRVINIISNELGREPTDAEISEELGIPITTITEWKQAIYTPSSLDENLGDDGNSSTRGDLTADTRTPGSDQGAIMADEQDLIKRFLDILTPRERDVLEERFGLINGSPRTLEEVGQKYQMTRERIRQIQEKALKKIRIRMAKYNPFKNTEGWDNDGPLLQIQTKASAKIISFSDDEILLHISKLPEDEQKVLRAWCGIREEKTTLKTISERLGISLSKIGILKDLALKRLPQDIQTALEYMGKSSKKSHPKT